MQQQAAPQTFHRGKDRILGGVCSGLAEGLHIDPLWVRLGFVLLAFLQGVGLFIYIVLWLVMPEQAEGNDGTRSGFDSMSADLKRIGSELRGQFGRTLIRRKHPRRLTRRQAASAHRHPRFRPLAHRSGSASCWSSWA
jgi:phage shock protein C